MAQARGKKGDATRSPSTEDAIARRTLRNKRTGRNVEMAIYAPQPDPKSNGDWKCAFSVRRGRGRREMHAGYGVDSLQALINACKGLRFVLEPQIRELAWFDQSGLVGLPLLIEDDEPEKIHLVRHLLEAEAYREAIAWKRITRVRHATINVGKRKGKRRPKK